MTPREELATMLAERMCGACKAYREHEEVADAILAAGYRKVEAGRDARETARQVIRGLKVRAYGDADATNELAGDFGSWAFLETEIATAITATVEAQLERDAELARRCIAGDALEEKEGSFHPASKIGQVRELANKIAAAIREG